MEKTLGVLPSTFVRIIRTKEDGAESGVVLSAPGTACLSCEYQANKSNKISFPASARDRRSPVSGRSWLAIENKKTIAPEAHRNPRPHPWGGPIYSRQDFPLAVAGPRKSGLIHLHG